MKGNWMGVFESALRPTSWLAPIALVAGLLAPSFAAAGEPFIHANEPIHPGCVHALAMHAGDVIPVITTVSLEGCRSSARTQAKIQRDGDVLFIEDEILLGEGTFGYRHLASLDNGIFILAIRRTGPEGSLRVSLAAMLKTTQPVLRSGEVGTTPVVETLGEVWLKDTRQASIRAAGNVVHYSVGIGPSRREATLDFSRIGKALRK
ncbi:MAG: hypothetical protein JRG92_22370 [Deltaproteobacteria bacterium]|nr:hypothetical protein [Deltaproteobacteria bacterium]